MKFAEFTNGIIYETFGSEEYGCSNCCFQGLKEMCAEAIKLVDCTGESCAWREKLKPVEYAPGLFVKQGGVVTKELYDFIASIPTEQNFDWSAVKVTAEKITHEDLMRRLTQRTWRGNSSRITNSKMYRLAHSPMRSQDFIIDLDNIPSFVSSHLCRAKQGVEHFVLSNRNDRGGADTTNRWTPVNHTLLINAEALVTLSHKRLCKQASKETVRVMEMIKEAVEKVDSDLVEHMIPLCFYRNGICDEHKSCNLNKTVKQIIN